MYRIEFDGFKPGAFTEVFQRLYSEVGSVVELPAKLHGYPAALADYIGTLYSRQGKTAQPIVAPAPLPQVHVQPSGNTVLVGFSGGKDSTAAALKLRAMGFAPVLFHVQGINPSYPRELDAAVVTNAGLSTCTLC